MRTTLLSVLTSILFTSVLSAQSVGINATGANPNPSAMLDISATDKGLLLPRVTLTATNNAAPVSTPATGLIVFNTATAGSGTTAVNPGLYFWTGTEWMALLPASGGWRVGGNFLPANSSFGSQSNHPVEFITNGITRGRMSNLGQFSWGGNPPNGGDLISATGIGPFPFTINGYCTLNGSAIYGLTSSGTSTYGTIQGEYNGSVGAGTAAMRGLNQTGAPGTGFRFEGITGPKTGVNGLTYVTSGQYSFGVYGNTISTDLRCAGVIGVNPGNAMGALGYTGSNNVIYSVYGFGGAYQPGISNGRTVTPDQTNTQIGLGIYGGVMGGWIRGMVYGGTLKGDRYSLYVDGKTYTNAPMTELINTGGENRTPAYAVTSLTTDIYAKGKAVISNGSARIDFDPAFLKLISENPEDIIITVTPSVRSKGLFIAAQDARGFEVSEYEKSNTAVVFNWMAMATRKNTITHAPEILQTDFDSRINGLMFNDNNKTDTPQSLWWDGTRVRFDPAPPVKPDLPAPDFLRNKGAEKTNLK